MAKKFLRTGISAAYDVMKWSGWFQFVYSFFCLNLYFLGCQKNLWNAWVSISELRHSVTLKKIKLLLLRQKLKLTSILKGQITYLEEWAILDRDHTSSLLGATEALQASTLRLPVVGKAIVDFQKLKDAVGSAADVMQAMASSICSLSLKVEEMNSLVSELMRVTATERFVLEQCKDFLSTLSAMQVKDCSLRTHIIQLRRVPTTRSLTTHFRESEVSCPLVSSNSCKDENPRTHLAHAFAFIDGGVKMVQRKDNVSIRL
ncbi:unknown function family protein DUF566 [Prunus dulcis]|uniref:QWRF motif protein n=1 Tax=Prunus dulcis TaxID=3755 RepID=A0A4Y1S0L7_PRUDU|nr:unknown function family protein DUF566 [Prunus dulcis]